MKNNFRRAVVIGLGALQLASSSPSYAGSVKIPAIYKVMTADIYFIEDLLGSKDEATAYTKINAWNRGRSREQGASRFNQVLRAYVDSSLNNPNGVIDGYESSAEQGFRALPGYVAAGNFFGPDAVRIRKGPVLKKTLISK